MLHQSIFCACISGAAAPNQEIGTPLTEAVTPIADVSVKGYYRLRSFRLITRWWISLSPETRAPLKRPWLTLAIDVFTRMIVGFHLSMDPPGKAQTEQM